MSESHAEQAVTLSRRLVLAQIDIEAGRIDENLAKLQLSRGFSTVADACAAAAAFLACFVVARISNAQQEKWQSQQRAEAQSANP